MAEADSTGTTVVDSIEEGLDLGADLDSSMTAESPTADSTTAQDAGTPDFDPSSVDIGKADPESLPEPYRKAQEWAKNRERELQGVMTRSTQETADLRRQLDHLQATVNTQAAPPAAAPAADPLEALRARLGEDAPAVDVVSDIIKAVTGDQAAASQSQAQELATLKEAVTALAQSMVSTQTAGMSQQVAEARAAYGETLDQYGPQIAALIKVENPATRQAYTVMEAADLVSGKAMAKSQELQHVERQVRSDASNATALPGAVGAANSDNGELTPSQLTAGLQKLGFE